MLAKLQPGKTGVTSRRGWEENGQVRSGRYCERQKPRVQEPGPGGMRGKRLSLQGHVRKEGKPDEEQTNETAGRRCWRERKEQKGQKAKTDRRGWQRTELKTLVSDRNSGSIERRRCRGAGWAGGGRRRGTSRTSRSGGGTGGEATTRNGSGSCYMQYLS